MTGASIRRADLDALEGREIGVSRWFTLDQDRIDAFARVTEDAQFIHVDPEAAARSPFGGTIAHGFLVAAMLSAMAYDAIPRLEGVRHSVNYGFDRLRFVSPVPSGADIRARFTLTKAEDRAADQVMLNFAVTVETRDAPRPALVADWRALYFL